MTDAIKDMILTEKGVWLENEMGLYMKAWKEGSDVIVRAYCEREDGETVIWSYRKKPEDLIIEESEGRVLLDLADAFADNVNDAECESDKLADREYEKRDFKAIRVKSPLVGKLPARKDVPKPDIAELEDFLSGLE